MGEFRSTLYGSLPKGSSTSLASQGRPGPASALSGLAVAIAGSKLEGSGSAWDPQREMSQGMILAIVRSTFLSVRELPEET